MQQWQKYLAEVFGTFTLVFLGCAGVAGFGGGIAPWAFGLGLLAALYAFAEVSGGHFNPAVSLGLFLDRRISAQDMVAYWVFQFAGGILGTLALLVMTSSDTVAKAATIPSSTRAGFFGEVFLTAIFLLVILQVTRSVGNKATVFVSISLTLAAIHFAGVPWSGASVNPARSFASALIGTEFTDFWIYIVGPPLGAILGWVVFSVVVKGKTDLSGDIDAIRAEVKGAAS